MDGTLDNSFGYDGTAIVSFGELTSQSNSILLDDNNNIIGVGSAYNDNTPTEIALTRLTTEGNIDSGFGINGIQTTTFPGYIYVANAALQGNKIIAGNANYLNGYRPLLARYNNDLTQKQIIITKIRRWLQHHHGITWNASSNISSYTVQRSSDGEHWSTIYHSPFTTNNHYNDPSPLNGANYYRLQTTSTDGAVAYSNIIAVANHEIKISPNPASNILHIEGLSSTNKTKITVIDFAGNIKQQAVAGNNACNVNIAALHPGNYLLKIEMNDGVVIKKFVKE
jgi:hypothetical protein